MVTDRPASGVQTIQRAAALIRTIGTHNRLGMRLVDLYRTLELERPTVHRLLQGLVSEGLVRQDARSKRYYLGPMIYELGLAATPKHPLRDICHRYLHTIAKHTGDTVFLTVRAGLDGLCVDRVEGEFPIKVFVLEVGKRRPLNVGGGTLAIMSALSDVEVNRICQANRERLTKRYPRYSDAFLWEKIAAARQRGYALNEVLEVPGVRSIAVAIRDARGRPVAGISVATLAERLEADRAADTAELMLKCASSIQDELQRLSPEDLV